MSFIGTYQNHIPLPVFIHKSFVILSLNYTVIKHKNQLIVEQTTIVNENSELKVFSNDRVYSRAELLSQYIVR